MKIDINAATLDFKGLNPKFVEFVNTMAVERIYQNSKWGDEFDSKNTPNDWVAYIARYLGRAVMMPWDKNTFKNALIKTATLCAAAYEWCERTDGKMPKRHYDD